MIVLSFIEYSIEIGAVLYSSKSKIFPLAYKLMSKGNFRITLFINSGDESTSTLFSNVLSLVNVFELISSVTLFSLFNCIIVFA